MTMINDSLSTSSQHKEEENPMGTPSQFVIRFIIVLCLVTTAVAQDNAPVNFQETPATVTAFASGERVRFTAPPSVVQIRLEVYNSTGKKVFDNEVRGGNVLDWHLQGGQAERLADDTYLCAVTIKSLSGKITQRIGSVIVEKSAASVQAIAASQMTAQQSETIGPLEENSSLSVLGEDEPETTTVIAHNGDEGQITRGRGALTFRIGDFFRGKDTEQMRLTPEGNLGIGLTRPQAKLDVDGLIRASQGIVFPDGSIQFSAAKKTFGEASLRPDLSKKPHGQDAGLFSPDTSGTGTTGKIPRWLDGPNGVLADSNITELNGSIGINGTPNSSFRLDVNGSTRIRGSNPGFNLEGLRPAGNIWLFQTVDDDGRFRLFSQDSTSSAERLTISLSGNVGIGTATPGAKLSVQSAGDPALQINHTGTSGNAALWFQQDGSTKAYVWWDRTGNRLNLGTPTTNPIISFHNDGTIKIPATTRYKSIHSSAFRAAYQEQGPFDTLDPEARYSESWLFGDYSACHYCFGGPNWLASVELPDGAVTTEFCISGANLAAGDPAISANLYKTNLNTGEASLIARTFTDGSTSFQNACIDSNDLVNNQNYAYSIKVQMGFGRLVGARIKYQVTQLP
jgi:hypothetical protein